MKSELNFEWLVETLDFYEGCGDDPDIIAVSHSDTYAEALSVAEHEAEPTRIGLVRDRWTDVEGLVDRQWAYLSAGTMGTLPERFSDSGGSEGALIPTRFHRELLKGKAA